MLLAAGLGANAQLANGSTAPDFTATDINGNTHSLYADYLDQGKTVIIDVSATWCGPCWGYHGTHALANLYEAYGPDGSDEVMVLFVEGDPSTTLLNIQGELDPSNGNIPTQGNWTIGSPYPIIDDASVGNLLEIEYFPTVYRICPDGTVTLVDQQTITQLVSGINSGCQTLEGVENHASLEASDARVCEAGAATSFSTTIKNFGTNAITSATVTLKDNGEVVATQDYTGTAFNQFATKTVTFEGVELDPAGNYTVEISNINGGTPANPELVNQEFEVTAAMEGTNNMIHVAVYTDNYPSEISWKIEDASGTVVAEGGDYEAGTEDQWGGGGPNANTIMNHYVALPAGDAQCYNVILEDAFNDGWSLGSTQHGIEIYSEGEVIFETWVGNFGSELQNPSAFRTQGTLGNEQFESSTFAIYPNPSTGIFNFATKEAVSVTVMDLTGKVVFTAAEINDGGTINLSSLSSGMYVAKVSGASFEKVEKLVIK